MFKYNTLDQHHRPVIYKWLLMTLNAGILNVGAYLSVGVFVTHVTGFATLFGTELAIHNFEQAIFFLIVPFFFLLGSLISGLLVDRRIVHKQKPRYDIALSLAGVLILLIAILGHWNDYSNIICRCYCRC
jgi:uncharacterized membrane protein YoaK (UPF0700 family)